MDYSFLQNFSSLLEVFTAVYVSMFIDDILSNIWTPKYKSKISSLIESMKIPAIGYIVKNVEDNIDANASNIANHMKIKAMYFVIVCMAFLLLAGLEVHSPILPEYGYLMVTILSIFSIILFILGKWAFRSIASVIVSVLGFSILFSSLYFTPLLAYLYGLELFSWVNDKTAACSFLLALSFPICWQLFLIWVYSSLYKGFMQEKISMEAYVYGKAYIAYKLKDMAALPKEYEMIARDFVTIPETNGDTSLNSLNQVLISRLEILCNPPHILKIFWSWIKFNLRGRKNPAADYIEQNGLDYQTIQAPSNIEPLTIETQNSIGCTGALQQDETMPEHNESIEQDISSKD